MGSGVEYAFHCNRHRGYEWILKCSGWGGDEEGGDRIFCMEEIIISVATRCCSSRYQGISRNYSLHVPEY